MNRSPCEELRESLFLLPDGLLDAEEEAAVRAHLETCLPCQEVLRELESLCAGIRRLPTPRAPAGFAQRVLERHTAGRGFRPRPWHVVATLAAAAVVVVVARFASHPPGPADDAREVQVAEAPAEVAPTGQAAERFAGKAGNESSTGPAKQEALADREEAAEEAAPEPFLEDRRTTGALAASDEPLARAPLPASQPASEAADALVGWLTSDLDLFASARSMEEVQAAVRARVAEQTAARARQGQDGIAFGVSEPEPSANPVAERATDVSPSDDPAPGRVDFDMLTSAAERDEAAPAVRVLRVDWSDAARDKVAFDATRPAIKEGGPSAVEEVLPGVRVQVVPGAVEGFDRWLEELRSRGAELTWVAPSGEGLREEDSLRPQVGGERPRESRAWKKGVAPAPGVAPRWIILVETSASGDADH